MVKDVDVKKALNILGAIFVDVRSEMEFREATIPGSINIPLLNDEERVRVGTIYKQKGQDFAKRQGLEIISPKLFDMLNVYDNLVRPGKKVILFCWRGGMRSRFVAFMLDMMGFDVYRVNGGYKEYRRFVNRYLNRDLLHRAVVLHGLTGVGKTLVLKKLEAMGVPVLDLEGLAVHRGSVYGKVGLPPSPSQKMFEGLVFKGLKEAEQNGLFIVECESRRLGNILVPTTIMNVMKKGYKVILYAPLKIRIQRSLQEYFNEDDKEKNINQLIKATGSLIKYLGTKNIQMLHELIVTGQVDKAVEFLLVKYYDPLYKYPNSPDLGYDLSVDTSDLSIATTKIYSFVTNLAEYNVPVDDGGIWDGDRENIKEHKGVQGNISGNC